jgi:diguanylate cyclase (GGDEF)-like protein
VEGGCSALMPGGDTEGGCAKVVRGPTIGVLSPYVGGSYYGDILAGIASAAAAVDGRVVAVQTLEAGSYSADLFEASALRDPIAWDHVAGFVVVANAVDADYLHALRAAGKSVVLVSHEYPEFACPVVLPDNGGIRDAVAHLIEHGHRRIAFVGFLAVSDIRERFKGYVETLREHGIEPDPLLCFESDNNHEEGGDHAARQMIAAGLPSTAVVVATDLNAVGVMRTLTAAGHRLPQDQAVVGFDDIDAARHLIPSLSSVRQQLADLGRTAVDLLIRAQNGENVAPGPRYVPAPFIIRESCGCSDDAAAAVADEFGTLSSSHERLTARLGSLLLPAAPGAEQSTALAEGVDAIVRLVDAAASACPAPVIAHLRHELNGLCHLGDQPEHLGAVTRVVREFGDEVVARASDKRAAARVEDRVHELTLALSQGEARWQFNDTSYFQDMLTTQYEVSMGLLRSHEEDPRSLGWLARSPARGGCLGLWSQPVEASDLEVPTSAANAADSADTADAASGDKELETTGIFVRDRVEPALGTHRMTASAFPPDEVLTLADEHPGDVALVVPVRTGSSDWGWLAVVGAIEARVPAGRELVNQSAALLAVALEHQAVLVALHEQEDQLRKSAVVDGLTGLPNRTLFLDRLSHAIARGKRTDECEFAVLFLDLDDFKVVNDSLGHAVGDRLLVQVAERIVDHLRGEDTAARFGGDEFLLLLEGTRDLAAANAIAARLQDALARPFYLEGEVVVVTASVGIALSAPRYDNAEDILRDADIAMYSAKSHQKGSRDVFDVTMHTKAVTRLQIEAELRLAVERGEFEVHYQPIVDLETRTLSAFEALIRWQHPSRGLLGPDLFLSVAEECGLMVPIGRWVLREACQQLAAWQLAGIVGSRVAMSVNVSNLQFWHDDLLGVVQTCLLDTGLPARCLALEITEGVVMSNVDQARRMLEDLHQLGVALHIDDFGTGYSSLEALHNLPLDALKIDRSFIARLDTDPRTAELVRTMVLMGANLGLDLVAEGIETTVQRDHLNRLGCTYGQGYLFSRPVTSAMAEQVAADLSGHQIAAVADI